MSSIPNVIEGTWEEVLEHASELQGRKVRVQLLPIEDSPIPESNPAAAASGRVLGPDGVLSPAQPRVFTTPHEFLEGVGPFNREEADALEQAIEENRTIRRSTTDRDGG
jgi:hypothetical protein